MAHIRQNYPVTTKQVEENPRNYAGFMERETGLEPATFCLEGRHSTN